MDLGKRCLRLLAAMLLCCIAVPAFAESLTTVRDGNLPTLGAGPVRGLATLEGGILALTETEAWLLPDGATSWRRALRPSGMTALLAGADRAYGLYGIAGNGGTTALARLRLVRGRLVADRLPALPVPLHEVLVTSAGPVVHVTGVDAVGQPHLLGLDASIAGSQWSELPVWPSRQPASSLVVQSSGRYVTVPQPTPAAISTPAATGAASEQLWRWTADTGWQQRAPLPGPLAGGFARAIGQAHVLYLLAPTGESEAARLVSFHTITGSWAELSAAASFADIAAPWRNGLVWARATPGGGGTSIGYLELEAGKYLLGWLDWLVIFVYLALMLGVGMHFYMKEKRASTSEFFVGGRSIPFWAAGISLYATNTSSISFVAIPAKAFETNWQYLTNNLVAVVGLVFVAIKIVPLLRRLDLMSVFSYLETRFHPAIRMLASGLCIAMQIGSRMSVILFLPAMAIATITGIDVVWSILIMGVFTIIYTAMGGMKAVIWTDFVQVFVMMGGALFAIGFIVYQLDGGFGELYQTAMEADKTRLFDFSFDLTKATVWGFIFLVVFDVVLTFPKDQVLMQRTLSTRSDKEAGRSIWAFALIMIPGGFIFYSIGTALYVFYKSHPERLNPLLSIDATFPLFIAAELPVGVTGLIIAGIFAAAMSTLSSIMNSVATLASVDFYGKLVRNPTPERSVRFAEIVTVLTGLVGIGTALLLSRYDIHSLFDVSIELAGLLGGGFAGAYTLGMFTRRANSPGVAIGIGGSIVLTLTAWTFDLVHPYFYLAISILLCIVIGYVASLFFPKPTRSLDGLTIYARSDSNYAEVTAARAAQG